MRFAFFGPLSSDTPGDCVASNDGWPAPSYGSLAARRGTPSYVGAPPEGPWGPWAPAPLLPVCYRGDGQLTARGKRRPLIRNGCARSGSSEQIPARQNTAITVSVGLPRDARRCPAVSIIKANSFILCMDFFTPGVRNNESLIKRPFLPLT